VGCVGPPTVATAAMLGRVFGPATLIGGGRGDHEDDRKAPLGTSTTRLPRIPGRAFLALGLSAFLVTANISTLNIAFPDMEATFADTPRAVLSWVFNAYTVTFAALLVPAGRFADRYGRRAMFRAGTMLFAVGGLAVGLAPWVWALILARVAQGVGAALLTPAAMGLLLMVTPASIRTRAVAAFAGVGSLGIAVGPSIGAFIVEIGGWRWAFLMIPVVAALAWAAAVGQLPETEPDPGAARPDLAGSLLLATSIALVVLALAQSRRWGVTSGGVLGALGAGLTLALVFTIRSRASGNPLIPFEMFRIRSFSAANAGAVVFGLALSAILLVNVLFLTGVWRYSILQAGLAATPAPVVVALLAPLAGRAAERFGQVAIATAGPLFFGAGIALYYWRLDAHPDFLADWLPGAVTVGIGISMTFPILNAAAVRDVDPDTYSLATGITQTGRQIGAALGIALTVAVLGDPPPPDMDPLVRSALLLHDLRQAWFFIGVFGTSAALAGALLGRSRHHLRAAGAPAGTAGHSGRTGSTRR